MKSFQLRHIAAIATVACTTAIAHEATQAPTDPVLQKLLLELRQIDQSALLNKAISPDQLNALQRENSTRLGKIVAQHGWPSLSAVGNDASQGAWLIVQHADYDRNWQRKMLGLMEPLIARGEIRKADVAYLRDRLDVADYRPQRYGTQGRCVEINTWQPFDLADRNNVDEWRMSMGMSSLEAYVQRAGTLLCKSFQHH